MADVVQERAAQGVHVPLPSAAVGCEAARFECGEQPELHTGPGLDQRPDLGVRLRPHRWLAAQGHGSDRPVENTFRVGVDLRRRSARGRVVDAFIADQTGRAGCGRFVRWPIEGVGSVLERRQRAVGSDEHDGLGLP